MGEMIRLGDGLDDLTLDTFRLYGYANANANFLTADMYQELLRRASLSLPAFERRYNVHVNIYLQKVEDYPATIL
jgi:hypothetical protein